MFTAAVVLMIALPTAAGTMTWIATKRHASLYADMFRAYRARLGLEPEYRAPNAGEAMGGELAHLASALEQMGLRRLGVLVEATQAIVTCWFVDEARTLVGLFGFYNGQAYGALLSFDAHYATITRMTTAPRFARAPGTTGVDVRPTARLADMLASHRMLAKLDKPIAIATLNDAVGAFRQVRARTFVWRDAQPEPELLEADLRAFLGQGYAQYGSAVARRLRADVPTARVIHSGMSIE